DPLANDPARAPDALHVSPSAIMLTYDVAADTPLPQTVVYLTTQRTTTWTVSSNVNWLAGTAQDGQTPDSFTLAALTYKLSDGTHEAQLTFKSSVGTVVVPVTLVLTHSSAQCDVNRDGASDNADIALVQSAVGTDNTQASFNYRNDFDRNG